MFMRQTRRIIIHRLCRKLHTSPNINPQSRAYPFQHVHPDSFVARHFSIGGFADPGQVDDVAGTISSPVQEEPEPGITEHCVETSLSSFPLVAWPRVESRRRGLFYHTGQQLCGHQEDFSFFDFSTDMTNLKLVTHWTFSSYIWYNRSCCGTSMLHQNRSDFNCSESK